MNHDMHMHTMYSHDSEENPLNSIKRAKELGLNGMYITDHQDLLLDKSDKDNPYYLDIPSYFEGISKLSQEYTDEDFFLGVGLELGLTPELADRHREMLEGFDFDFIIGSIHIIDNLDPYYYKEFFDGYTIMQRYQQYLDYTYENLVAYSDIDTLGHMDYIARYGIQYAKYKGIEAPECYQDEGVERILDFLIKNEISLEVNTAQFKYGFTQPNPTYKIIKKYYDMGGRMITTGSDAHQAVHVGYSFDEVSAKLMEIGFDSYFIYKKRQPIQVPFR